jgi:hypothetical protein
VLARHNGIVLLLHNYLFVMLKIMFPMLLLLEHNSTVLLLHSYLFVMLKIRFSHPICWLDRLDNVETTIQVSPVQARAPRVGWFIGPTPCPPSIYPFWPTLWLVVQELQVVSRIVITANVPSF